MKKAITAFITIIIWATIFSNSFIVLAKNEIEILPFKTNSESIYLYELNTNQVVFSQNENKVMYPASLTKILTTIICLEEIQDIDNTFVTMPEEIFYEFQDVDISNADIKIGEKISIRDLLYATMLPSACEAASALAYYLTDGDIPVFITKMNDLAKKIGAFSSNFVNPHGLFDKNQYTTAADMALITEYALKNERFVEISTTAEYTMQKTNLHSERIITHTNSLLDPSNPCYFKYARGIKTGSLPESGKNLISFAENDEFKFILVTLNAPLYSSSQMLSCVDQKNIFEWGFSKLKKNKLIEKGEKIGSVKINYSDNGDKLDVLIDEDFSIILENDIDDFEIKKNILISESLDAPISIGDKLGEIELINSKTGESIYKKDLKSDKDMGFSFLKKSINDIMSFLSMNIVKTSIIIILLFIIMLILLKVYRKVRRERLRERRKRRH